MAKRNDPNQPRRNRLHKKRTESLPTSHGATFTIGDGVHHGFNGDRYPGTVLYVSDSGREVYVSDDKYTIIDNLGAHVEGDRECKFESIIRSPDACTIYKLRKKRGKMYFVSPGTAVLCQGRAYARNPHV